MALNTFIFSFSFSLYLQEKKGREKTVQKVADYNESLFIHTLNFLEFIAQLKNTQTNIFIWTRYFLENILYFEITLKWL